MSDALPPAGNSWLARAITPALTVMFKGAIPADLCSLVGALHTTADNTAPNDVLDSSQHTPALDCISFVDMHLDRDFRWYLLAMHGLAWNEKAEVYAVTRVTTHEDDAPKFDSTVEMSEDEARARLVRLGVVIPALAYFSEKEGDKFAGESMTTLSAQWRRAHDTPPAWEDLLSEPDGKPCIRDGLVVIRRPRRWEVYQQQGRQAVDHAAVRMLYVHFWLKTRYQYKGERTRMHDAYAKVDHSRTEGAITMAGHGWQAA